MCDRLPDPGSVSDALAMLDRALDYLNTADMAALPVDTQAQALRSLETAEAKHTAARTALLSAFTRRRRPGGRWARRGPGVAALADPHHPGRGRRCGGLDAAAGRPSGDRARAGPR